MPSLSDCVNEIAGIFTRAEQEHFEAVVESEFARELEQAFDKFGAAMFIPLTILVIRGNVRIICELLWWVGRFEDESSVGCRREVLLAGLERSDISVKHSAILGVASMADPFFIGPLEVAVKREEQEELRRAMEQVLSQLRETKEKSSESISP